MKQILNKYCAWSLGIVASLFVFLNIDSMWGLSVDLAHHYSLVFRISEQWVLTSTSDPTLGEMNVYPRGGHVIAVVVGLILNSPFLGLQVTSLIAFALLWLFAILILDSFPEDQATISVIVLLGLIVVNVLTVKFDLHGHEIVGNFFYSQLIGHSILFASIFAAITLEKKYGVIWSCAGLLLLMLVNAAIHLLPALQMVGLIVGLLAVYVFQRSPGFSIVQKLKLAVPLGAFSICAILLHPSFSAMRKIAENNGYLILNRISYPVGLITLCIIVVLASMTLFFQWWKVDQNRGLLASKYLAIYGIVTAFFCLLQYVLTFYGSGSDYAVKKYGFGLTTILFLQLSIILSGRVSLTKLHLSRLGSNVFRIPILCVTLTAALFYNVPDRRLFDVSEVVLFERKLINIVDTILPIAEDGKPNVVIGLNDFPVTINYLFSTAIAKTPRQFAVPDVLKNELADPAKYSYIISSAKNRKFGSSGCEGESKSSISITPSQCIAKRKAAASRCDQTFDLSAKGAVADDLVSGFSSPEEHGRWTDGNKASFECVIGDGDLKSVKIEVAPFIYGRLRSQHIEVSLNGRIVYQENLSSVKGPENPIFIELPKTHDLRKHVLEFKLPDATSPQDVGYNQDSRKLGFAFRRIIFE